VNNIRVNGRPCNSPLIDYVQGVQVQTRTTAELNPIDECLSPETPVEEIGASRMPGSFGQGCAE